MYWKVKNILMNITTLKKRHNIFVYYKTKLKWNFYFYSNGRYRTKTKPEIRIRQYLASNYLCICNDNLPNQARAQTDEV